MRKTALIVSLVATLLAGCTENYSNGERIGLITQFSRTGVLWKSWEGHLNLTQTGMNSSSAVPFDFSIDNDHEPAQLVNTIDSAAQYGWKVKLIYHETFGKNWFSNRGGTDHFIEKCEVLDKTPVQSALGSKNNAPNTGHIIDTIYVVIDKSR
jgi:hypothetical protein